VPAKRLFEKLRWPVTKWFRRKRMRTFASLLPMGSKTQVLDVGGYGFYWRFIREEPTITLVNNYAPPDAPQQVCEKLRWVVADGCLLPFPNRSVDISFSNSVIEHVGDHDRQRAFAREMARVGKCYFVQTPNRWFFIEPHLATPLIHFLPLSWQRKLLRNFTLWGLINRPSLEQCDRMLAGTRLLTHSDMRDLFPDGVVLRERFLFMTKSLIAFRNTR
jgi:hypothetical protein